MVFGKIINEKGQTRLQIWPFPSQLLVTYGWKFSQSTLLIN